MGISFSMLLALTAAVAWLRQAERPSRWALLGTGALAALTAMHSWIAIASLGLLLPWLFWGTLQRRRSGNDRDALAVSRDAAGRLRMGWLHMGWSPALTAVTAWAPPPLR